MYLYALHEPLLYVHKISVVWIVGLKFTSDNEVVTGLELCYTDKVLQMCSDHGSDRV